MPDAVCTRGLVCNMRKQNAHEMNRYRRSNPAFPAQWLYGLCRALPGDEFVLSPSLADQGFAEPGWVRLASAKLGTSNGCQDHTVWPYVRAPFVLRAARSLTRFISPCDRDWRASALASTTSRPAFVTTRDPPLSSERDGAIMPVICVVKKREYLCAQVWTGQISLKSLGKFCFWCIDFR
jgi:hypothetical protein